MGYKKTYCFAMNSAAPGKEMDLMNDFIIGDSHTEERHEFAIACEEAFMNICDHAYEPDRPGPVMVVVRKEVKKITAVFMDCGAPYNPLKEALPVFYKERVGGQGLRIMRSYSKMKYTRLYGINILKLERKVSDGRFETAD